MQTANILKDSDVIPGIFSARHSPPPLSSVEAREKVNAKVSGEKNKHLDHVQALTCSYSPHSMSRPNKRDRAPRPLPPHDRTKTHDTFQINVQWKEHLKAV